MGSRHQASESALTLPLGSAFPQGQKKRDVIDRYGNAAETANGAEAPSELLFGQTEAYQEYDRAGRLIRGAERAVPRSKWEARIVAPWMAF